VHNTTVNEGQTDNEEAQAENASAKPSRADNEPEPDPLKTQHVIFTG